MFTMGQWRLLRRHVWELRDGAVSIFVTKGRGQTWYWTVATQGKPVIGGSVKGRSRTARRRAQKMYYKGAYRD